MRGLIGFVAIIMGLAMISPASAQQAVGGEIPAPRDNASSEIDAKMPGLIMQAERMGLRSPVAPQLINRNAALKLTPPLRMRPHSKRRLANTLSGGVDHDSSSALQSYDCGVRTYNGHRGIDYSLGAYSWRTMENQEVQIVAAAPGVILEKDDGNYDRQCSWMSPSPPANYVIIHQDDGLFAFYWHMKTGSPTSKAVGARVARGEYLGLVGSSGFSTGPHLHFELREVRGSSVSRLDPYAGACNAAGTGAQSGNISLWRHQHEVLNTELVRLSTHSIAPPSTRPPASNPPNDFCDLSGNPINPDPGYSSHFAPGSTVYPMIVLRDQRHTTAATMQIIRPDGSVHSTGTSGTPPPPPSLGYYRSSYWFWSRTLASNEQEGLWKFRVRFNGRFTEHTFRVSANPPATGLARVRALIEPQARSPLSNVATSVTAYVKNVSNRTAFGCWLTPDYPLAASFSFRRVNAAGVPAGGKDRNFNVPANSTVKVRLTFKSGASRKSTGSEIPIHVQCQNGENAIGSGTKVRSGYNTLKLSFLPTAQPDIAMVSSAGSDFSITMPSTSSKRVVVVRARNIGAASTAPLTIRPRAIANMPLGLALCEVDASNKCVAAFTTTLQRSFAAGQTRRFKVRLLAKGTITSNEVNRRVVVEALTGKVVRGATSFAVATP